MPYNFQHMLSDHYSQYKVWKVFIFIPSVSDEFMLFGVRNPEQWLTGSPFDAWADLSLVVIDSAPSSPYMRNIYLSYIIAGVIVNKFEITNDFFSDKKTKGLKLY